MFTYIGSTMRFLANKFSNRIASFTRSRFVGWTNIVTNYNNLWIEVCRIYMYTRRCYYDSCDLKQFINYEALYL